MEPDPELRMTVEQFRYHVKKCETPVERQIKKVGKKTFDLKDRVQLSYAKKGIGFPGHTYLIDSTIIDVYCVSAVDRRLLIGRPVVYVVIDAFSQMIMSVHVALEGPDMDQAKIALYRAISSKDEHFKNLGVVGCTDAFVQGVKPLFIFADRGEMLSKEGRELAECVQLAESFAASYRADWKSLVERYFGVQNTDVVHWLPGGVRKRQKERGDRDYRLDAVLTVNELTRILLNLAAQWNLTHDMSQHVSCNMLQHEIDATPRAFWDYGLTHLHGSGTYIEKHAAVKNFLPTVKAKADKRGLEVLETLRFTANWMRDKSSYFEIIEGSNEAEIFLNPDKPMGAYFLDWTDNNLMECDLVDTREYQSRDVSLEDIRMFEDYQPLKEGDRNKDKEVINDSFANETKKIIRNAAAETKDQSKTDDRSKTKRVSDIKGSRAKEVNSDFERASSAQPTASVPVQKNLAQSWYSKFIDSNNTDTK
jgi:transposase InsO family protein